MSYYLSLSCALCTGDTLVWFFSVQGARLACHHQWLSVCDGLVLNEVCWCNGHVASVHTSTGYSLERWHSRPVTHGSFQLQFTMDPHLQYSTATNTPSIRVPRRWSTGLRRSRFWIRCLPKSFQSRTNLLVSGDFIASISYHPPNTGSGIFRSAKPVGRELLTRFVTSNILFALNTFVNPLPTYISPTGRSQIDFIMQPAFQVTPTSKQVKALSQFPLGSWRAGGRHRPLATSIVPFAPWIKSPSFRKSEVSGSRRSLLADHVRQCTPQAHALLSLRRPKLAGDFFLHPDEVNALMVEEASRISLHSPSRSEDIPTAQPIWQALRERRRIHRLRLANPTSLRLMCLCLSTSCPEAHFGNS